MLLVAIMRRPCRGEVTLGPNLKVNITKHSGDVAVTSLQKSAHPTRALVTEPTPTDSVRKSISRFTIKHSRARLAVTNG